MKKLEDEGFSPSLSQFKNVYYRILPDQAGEDPEE